MQELCPNSSQPCLLGSLRYSRDIVPTPSPANQLRARFIHDLKRQEAVPRALPSFVLHMKPLSLHDVPISVNYLASRWDFSVGRMLRASQLGEMWIPSCMFRTKPQSLHAYLTDTLSFCEMVRGEKF
jgi:hypothetical protein